MILDANLISWKLFHKFGLKKSSLVPVKGEMNAIYGEGIDIIRAVFPGLEGIETGQIVRTGIFACIHRKFLSQSSNHENDTSWLSVKSGSCCPSYCLSIPRYCTVRLPKRTLPPKSPDALPFAPTGENVNKMKVWILDYFSSSTFHVFPQAALSSDEHWTNKDLYQP